MSGSCGSGANSFGAGRAVTTGGAGAAGAGAAATGGAGAAATGAPVGGGAAAWVTAGCLAQPVTNRARMTAAETSAWRERVMVSSPSYGQARACNGRSAEAIGPWSQAVKTRNGVDTSVVPERVNAAPADHVDRVALGGSRSLEPTRRARVPATAAAWPLDDARFSAQRSICVIFVPCRPRPAMIPR